MKLSIVSDKHGIIRGVAVCHATSDAYPGKIHEISITGKLIKAKDTDGHEIYHEESNCHVVDAPPHISKHSGEELHKALAEFRTTMRVKTENGKITLHKHAVK
jgi:hypothetical protein